jgi:hypothetical protein
MPVRERRGAIKRPGLYRLVEIVIAIAIGCFAAA